MVVYLDLVIILNFLVDFLLLLGTNRLCGHGPDWGRCALGAGIGGVYGGACLLPGFRFLGNSLWRVVSLALIAWIAFGHRGMLRRGCVFVLVSMALGGIALGMGNGGIWSLLAGAAGILLLCGVGIRDKIGSVSYVPVELRYGGHCLHLTALEDTGNALTDPVTGRPVLVVSAEIAQKLTGLTPHQLRHPVETVAAAGIPGLRLIPYRAIGQPGGFLLALRIKEVRVGHWKGSSLVAFAPEGLSMDSSYQALSGGAA